jgi:outer membrane murein-binding lipoprotein Lpp
VETLDGIAHAVGGLGVLLAAKDEQIRRLNTRVLQLEEQLGALANAETAVPPDAAGASSPLSDE